MALIGIDFETASACDLKTAGAWRYSLHETTKVWCAVVAQRVGSELKVYRWQPGKPPPKFGPDATMLAHNSAFERAIWRNVLTARFGWPEMPTAWEDTQAHAAAANLPITLEGLASALGCPTPKDMDGNALSKKMCVLTKDALDGWSTKHDTIANQERLLAYCETDVRAMFECWDRVPKMTPAEKALWVLDQKINDRGVWIDRELVRRMLLMSEKRAWQLQQQTMVETCGDLLSPSDPGALKTWLQGKGVELPTVKRTRVTGEEHRSVSAGRDAISTLAKQEGLDPSVKAVVDDRLEASKLTSLAKLKKVEHIIDTRDGRLRGSLQFCAAHTGRWSSRGLQLHNLARPRKGDTEEEKKRLQQAYAAVLQGDFEALVGACQ